MVNKSKKTKKEQDFIRFKKLFLLEFTRQLIKHSVPSELIKLQTIVEKEKEDKIEEVKRIIKDKEEKDLLKVKEIEGKTKEVRSIVHAPVGMFGTINVPHINPFKESFGKRLGKNKFADPLRKISLSIPESRFPVHLQYIKPVPMNTNIELGKLDALVNDPRVRIIECHGPGENIIVQGKMGTKKTGITLDKEEIDTIIQRFSRETKIPVQEGIFKVVAGRLIFMAIISNIVGSKFTIKKMLYETPPVYVR